MIARGRESYVTLPEITSKISESEILYYYLRITEIPCVINSPLRDDRRPSFGLFSGDGEHIRYKDFSTKESGNLYNLLGQLWNTNFNETIHRIYKDIIVNNHTNYKYIKSNIQTTTSNSKLDVKVRDWQQHDLDYWGSYGITLKWLQWADVYPISHKIITKFGHTYVFSADKYAYVYVERKEGNVTLKVYQPFNTDGYKWSNKHDKSVISLWTKIPKYGDRVVICSSLKDALCLSANTNISALSIQGEGYGVSDTAIKELKRRFTKQYIILDNDKVGLSDAISLAEKTGFTNIVLPQFEGGKDLSDYCKLFGKEKFIILIKNLFNDDKN